MDRTKYPRTHQLPWSLSNSSDDVWWENCDQFVGKEVVVTEKIDGENTTIYPDAHTHARSVDSRHHPSRSQIKALAAEIGYQLDEGVRICGENVNAYHSIYYTDLPTYFFVFGVYRHNTCLSWNLTEEYCHLLNLQTVPVIYRGIWDEEKIKSLWSGEGAFPTYSSPAGPPCEAEGYVVRVASAFDYNDFEDSVAKFVRANHVQTDTHWMHGQMIPNQLLSA